MADDGDSVSSSASSVSASSSREKRTASKHGTSSSLASSMSRKHAAHSQTSTSSSISARRYAAYSYEMSSPSSPSPPVLKQYDAGVRLSSSPGLSSEEFKSRLYHTFKERGLVDSLKSQLRTKLISELQQSALGSHLPNQNRENLLEGASLLHRAANSLVADHLKRCGYDYSLAVFLPESESVKDKLFTLHDLLELLKIHPDSKLGQKLIVKISSQPSKGLLWQILCEVARNHEGGSEEIGIQVDENPPHLTSIESKLKSVDRLYKSKAEEENLGQYGIMQDKLTSLQRQIEARFKIETNMEISRFKESELKRVELEEREKCRKEIARARREMEQTYRAKSEALQERERSAMERLQKEREHVERETYSQRQSLLEELQVLRQRETELKREADVNARAAKFEEERCKTMEENLKIRETAVANIQDTYDKRFKEQTRQFELEVQAKYSDRLRELDEKESKFRGEKRNLQEEGEKLKGLKDDLKDKQARLNEVETLLQQMRHDAMAAEKRNEVLNEKVRDMIDYQTVKETNAVLKRELENAKLRLSEFSNEQKMERARHEELVKQMTDQLSRPSPEMMTLQGDLTRARQQVQHEKTLMEHRDTQMKNKLQAEKEQNFELRRQLEEQSKQMGDMNKQLSDLRAVLRETQTALQNEVYRRPIPAAGRALLRSPTHPEHVPVHDQVDPEDHYIDTNLRQSQVDPVLLLASARRTLPSPASVDKNTKHQERIGGQRLLAADDTRDNFQPIEGLDTMSTQHQTRMGHQRLLADEDGNRDLQPMTGNNRTQTSRLLDDVSGGRSFAPMHRLESTASDEGEVSADNSLAFLEETRQRFRQLEKEAEELEHTYQGFQYRVTNPQAIQGSAPKSRIPTGQTQGAGHSHRSLQFATPLPARQTADSGREVNKSTSPPEPLVEYPLRDSVDTSTFSHYRDHPVENKGTRTKMMMNTTGNITQATPLENIPLDEGMDTTKVDKSRKSVPSRSVKFPETRDNVSLQSRGVLSSRTTVLPEYELSAQNQSDLAEADVDQQRIILQNVPTAREQMSHFTHGTSFTPGDRLGNMRYDSVPRMDDLSNLTDQSQLTMKFHHKTSLSSLSEHSLHSEHLSMTNTPPPYSPQPTDDAGHQPPEMQMPKENDSSSSQADLDGDTKQPKSNEKASSGFIPQLKEQDAERLRRLQEEEREEREWEERRKQKEEERKRREEEAREREQQMLIELQRQEEQAQSHHASDNDDKSGRGDGKKEEEKGDKEEETGEAVQKGEDAAADEGLNIDPVMQKYMQMVQQKKQQEKGSKVKTPDEDYDDDDDFEQKASTLSGLSQHSLSSVEAGDKKKSQGATSDEDDPFDDW